MRIDKIVIISLFAFVIQLTGCEEKELEIKVQGIVTDITSHKYEPIDGAEVKLWIVDRPYLNFLTKTNSDTQGFYFLTYIIEGEFHRLSISATKDGYYPSLREAVNSTENLQTINLKLQKKSTINDSIEASVF